MHKNTATRANIVSMARNAIVNDGYEALKLTDIARALGIKHSAIYYYFKNKEDLARYIQDQYFHDIFLELETIDHVDYENPMALLIHYIYLLHRGILEDEVIRPLFLGESTYTFKSYERMNRIVEICLNQFNSIMGSRYKLSTERLLKGLLVWEASTKSLYYHIEHGYLNMTFNQVVYTVGSNLLLNWGLNPDDIEDGYKEFRAKNDV